MITFSDNIARKPYLGSTPIAEIWLAHIKIYPDGPADYSKDYLTFDILQSGNIGYTLSTNTLQYSKDGGKTWNDGSPDTNIPVNAGDKVSVKFTNPVLYKEDEASFNTNGICKFYTDCNFNLYGNVMSLLYGDDFKERVSFEPMQDNYGNTVDMNHLLNLFFGCTGLISAENLSLSATTLKEACYEGMFQGCTSLTTAPRILPATTLTNECYHSMFRGCTGLVNVPELPATTLDNKCYSFMFQGCTSLTTAPRILPATTLTNDCYSSMFRSCRNLRTAPELPATTLAQNCYGYMFSDCTNLVNAPDLPATELANDCYTSMFRSCTNLRTAPALSATTLAKGCCQYMFRYCTSLVNTPDLLATTLTESCYYHMFEGCTSLATVSDLLATTLEKNCYSSMFDGCTSLNYIKAMFTTTPSTTYTSQWVRGVASTGTFVKNAAATWNVTGNHGIPTGWTVTTE